MTQMADRVLPPNKVMIIELACFNNLLKIVFKSAVCFLFLFDPIGSFACLPIT